MKVVVVGPADAAAVAADCAPPLLPQLRDVVGYAARPTELLVTALLRAGVQVELVTLSTSVTTPRTMSAGGLSVLVGRYRPAGRARDAFAVERRHLAALVKQTEGDVVHAHWTYEFAWSILTDRRPRMVTVHDAPLTILRHMPSAYRAVRAGMAYRVRAGHFRGIAVSPYVAARWRRQMVDPRPMQVIPNLISVGGRRAGREATSEVRLVSVGDAGPLKNVRSLVRAFRLVRQRHPAASLRLVGPGLDPVGPLAEWASARGLDEGVRWLGRLGHGATLDELATATAVVHPSLEESFGMSVAEAMAMGVPVVGGRGSGAVHWLLDGGRVGVLVDVRSASSVAEGVLRVLDDPPLARTLGSAAASRIAGEFSPESVLGAHLRVYEQAAGARPGSPGRGSMGEE